MYQNAMCDAALECLHCECIMGIAGFFSISNCNYIVADDCPVWFNAIFISVASVNNKTSTL